MSIDTAIAPIYSRFLDMVERHLKYITSASSYVENLQRRRAVLNARKEDLKEKIEEGERNSQRPTNEMVVWQEEAAAMLGKIDATIRSAAQETTSCAFMICSSYKIGRSCAAMLQEAEQLTQSFEKLPVEMVNYDNSKLPIPMGYVVPESLDLNSAEAQKYIEDDESDSNVIGICGLGGVGKTTLLKKIHNSCTEKSMEFKLVIWIDASSERSTNEKIQEKIVGELKLKKQDDAHSQARIVHTFLRDKNFFLFIDNLWKAVNLDEIGVPSTYEEVCSLKRKFIFTTRSKMVCRRMRADKIIEVECLDRTQSMVLFGKYVSEQILSDHRISKIAQDVVEECQGLPLAIVVIGQAMFKNKNIDEWKIALNQLKNSHDYHVLDADKQLLSVLKISYDYLAGDLLKKCFLSISVWPESCEIVREELIEFWMGLGFIDNFETMDQAYEIGYSLIRSLQDACLLEDVERFETVKMHDVIRDLAIRIASDYGKRKNKWMIKAGIGLQEAPGIQAKWSEAECISLFDNKIKELPSGIPSCPNLSTLILQRNYFAESEFDFGKFHSLTYLNLCNNALNHFPKSICDLTELQYLNVSYNSIRELPVELKNLKKLKYLMLGCNPLRNVPQEVFSELAKLLVLDMFNAIDDENDSFIDMKALLKGIEKQLLYFGGSVRSEEKLDELMSLSKLCIKELEIKGFHATSSFHFVSKLGNHHRLKRLHIQECGESLSEIVFDQKEIHHDFPPFNLEYLKICYISNLKRIIWKDIAPKRLFAELREVEIYECGLEDTSWVIHLPSLKRLILQSCDSMRIAINKDLDSMAESFPSLESLYLFDMRNLEKISTRPLAFGQLKIFFVYCCPLLKALPFSANTAPKLALISGDAEWWEKVEWEDVNSRVHFTQFYFRFMDDTLIMDEEGNAANSSIM